MMQLLSEILRGRLGPYIEPLFGKLGGLVVRAFGGRPSHTGIREDYIGMGLVLAAMIGLIIFAVLSDGGTAGDRVR